MRKIALALGLTCISFGSMCMEASVNIYFKYREPAQTLSSDDLRRLKESTDPKANYLYSFITTIQPEKDERSQDLLVLLNCIAKAFVANDSLGATWFKTAFPNNADDDKPDYAQFESILRAYSDSIDYCNQMAKNPTLGSFENLDQCKFELACARSDIDRLQKDAQVKNQKIHELEVSHMPPQRLFEVNEIKEMLLDNNKKVDAKYEQTLAEKDKVIYDLTQKVTILQNAEKLPNSDAQKEIQSLKDELVKANQKNDTLVTTITILQSQIREAQKTSEEKKD